MAPSVEAATLVQSSTEVRKGLGVRFNRGVTHGLVVKNAANNATALTIRAGRIARAARTEAFVLLIARGVVPLPFNASLTLLALPDSQTLGGRPPIKAPKGIKFLLAGS